MSEIEANSVALRSGLDVARKTFDLRPATLFFPVVMFIVTIAYLPGVVSPSEAGRWAVITLIGLPTILIAITEWFYWSYIETKIGVLLAVWLILSLFWTVSTWDTLGTGLHWLALAGFFVLAFRQRDLKLIWLATALGVSMSLPFVVLQALGYHPVMDVGRLGFPPTGGLYLTSDVLAECSTIVLVAIVARREWYFAALIPGLIGCAFLSGRKEVGLMIFVAALVWLWQTYDWRRFFILCGAVLLPLGVVYWLWYGGTTAFVHVSFLQRLQIWADTVVNLGPLGWGLDTFGAIFLSYNFVHNDTLQLMFELGFGSLLLFWLVGRAFRASALHERMALAAFVASAMVWAPIQSPTTACLAVVLTGHLCGLRYRARCTQPNSRAQDLSGAGWDHTAPAALSGAVGSGEVLAARS